MLLLRLSRASDIAGCPQWSTVLSADCVDEDLNAIGLEPPKLRPYWHWHCHSSIQQSNGETIRRVRCTAAKECYLHLQVRFENIAFRQAVTKAAPALMTSSLAQP